MFITDCLFCPTLTLQYKGEIYKFVTDCLFCPTLISTAAFRGLSVYGIYENYIFLNLTEQQGKLKKNKNRMHSVGLFISKMYGVK